MEIIKNNGKILIEQNKHVKSLSSVKVLYSYKVTVIDVEGSEKLKGNYEVQQIENKTIYKFYHNSSNCKLAKYVSNEVNKCLKSGVI